MSRKSATVSEIYLLRCCLFSWLQGFVRELELDYGANGCAMAIGDFTRKKKKLRTDTSRQASSSRRSGPIYVSFLVILAVCTLQPVPD